MYEGPRIEFDGLARRFARLRSRASSVCAADRCRGWSAITVVVLVAAIPLVPRAAQAAEPSEPRNVILIIGDGMDDNQITIARNHLVGARGKLTLDRMPVRSAVQVLAVAEEDPERVVYVADSANSATSMSSGVVTSRGRIATTAERDEDVVTILELARDAGMATGLVTTSSLTDATPAAFAAHVNLRGCENPTLMESADSMGFSTGSCMADMKRNGGRGSISEQLAASAVDVMLGGGLEHFAPPIEGGERTVVQEAERVGYRVLEDGASLGEIGPSERVLGLFADDHLAPRWRGEGGREAEQPDPNLLNSLVWFLGSVDFPEPMGCEPNPEYGATPSLAAMTAAALGRLSADPHRGFFLMIESASIDKQSHERNACGAIGELQQLDEALALSLELADRMPGTLVLVTADHGHAAQIVPEESLFEIFDVPVYTPGHLVRLRTHDGSTMAVNYATTLFYSEEHTGVHVPLFANREGRGLVDAMIVQPDLFEIMRQHLGL